MTSSEPEPELESDPELDALIEAEGRMRHMLWSVIDLARELGLSEPELRALLRDQFPEIESYWSNLLEMGVR